MLNSICTFIVAWDIGDALNYNTCMHACTQNPISLNFFLGRTLMQYSILQYTY